jgi:hypothetical protein
MQPGVLRVEELAYRGKRYQVPSLDPADPVVLTARPLDGATRALLDAQRGSPILQKLHTTWDLANFLVPRRPVRLGILDPAALATMCQPDAVRVLDLPVKMPDLGEVRLPRALARHAPVVQRILDV